MKETSCNVIRDLLPLYEDNAVSEETAELVRSHLKDCPACREELRKMRTPISLPPEEDREMLARYQRRQESARRQKRNILIGIGAVLAVIALFCLWYTRPRSWRDIAAAQDEEITSLAASLSVPFFHSDGSEPKFGWDIWNLDADQAKGAAIEAVTQTLDRHTYRASLGNLLSRFKDGYSVDNPGGTLHLSMVLKYPHWETPSVYENGQVYFDSDRYYFDKGLYEELAQIIQKYGTLQED